MATFEEMSALSVYIPLILFLSYLTHFLLKLFPVPCHARVRAFAGVRA